MTEYDHIEVDYEFYSPTKDRWERYTNDYFESIEESKVVMTRLIASNPALKGLRKRIVVSQFMTQIDVIQTLELED